MICVDYDDFGYEHDCRMELEKLKEINPKFKVTLFTIPALTTIEMLRWASDNDYWVEIAQHGWNHHSNYECANWTYDECCKALHDGILLGAKGFKAPGWQISDDCYLALRDYGYWVSDQSYNDGRRPPELPAYCLMADGTFRFRKGQVDVPVEAYHGHTWSCNCGNGIDEDWNNISQLVKEHSDFKFISEIVYENS
jgi:hypothetical protein